MKHSDRAGTQHPVISRKQLLRNRIRVVLVAAFCSSLLFMLWFTGLMTGLFPSVNPVLQIRAGMEKGFAWPVFYLSFFTIILSAFFIAKKQREENFNMHPIDINRKSSDTDNYGRAEFEKPWEYRPLAQIRSVENCIGHIYGMLDDAGRECVDFFPDPNDSTAHLNNHIFAVGASGSGKTYSVGMTYCLQSIKIGHSVIHTDPKGELFTELADIYRKHGYYVRRLNFNNPRKSDGWDCMKSLREEKDPITIELLAEKFATVVVSQICSDHNVIYYTGPVMLLKALLLRLVLDDDIPDEQKNIKTIYSWVTDSGGIEFLNTLFDKDTLKAKVRPCLAPWGTFKGASGNLSGNLLLNLGAGISVLSNEIVADILSTDQMDLLLPGESPCAYFIQFPVPNEAFRFPVSLFFTMLFEALQSHATQLPGHRLNIQVDFYLDEFAQCGVFPNWDQRMSVIRSYGLNVFMIVQTIAQFKNLYNESMDTVISNCATWLMLGTNDQQSAEMFSKRIGQTTIEVQSESRQGFRRVLDYPNSASDRVSVGTGKTSLLSSDEIMKLPANTLIILFQRHNPVWANSVPYILHPYSRGSARIDENKELFFYDSDNLSSGLPTKRAFFISEKNRIIRFWQDNIIFSPPADINNAPYSTGNNALLKDIFEILFGDFHRIISFFSFGSFKQKSKNIDLTSAFSPVESDPDSTDLFSPSQDPSPSSGSDLPAEDLDSSPELPEAAIDEVLSVMNSVSSDNAAHPARLDSNDYGFCLPPSKK